MQKGETVDHKILCISGRKQAGKDTCYKFLRNLLTYGGSPWARDQAIQQFYFAEPLKRMCVDILGCPEDKVYGTDEDKNSFVIHLLWENFPVPVYDMPNGSVYVANDEIQWVCSDNVLSQCPEYYGDGVIPIDKLLQQGPKRKRGPMTIREVLQYWGSEIFRRQYKDVWADACIRAIRKSNTAFAVITDCRFENELEAAQKAGGKVVRLNRIVFPEDKHASETSLDPDKFNRNKFDYFIDNQHMDIWAQCVELYLYLHCNLNWIPDYPRDVIDECVRRVES